MALAAAGGGERQFLDAAERAARFPRERLALVLHLSRLRPPGPRPHHRRVADALLRDAAERHEGQVFALGNDDRVLLCEARAVLPARGSAPAAVDPVALPALLGRLLRLDAPDPAALVSLWPLATESGALLAYARARLAEAAARTPRPGDTVATPASLDALAPPWVPPRSPRSPGSVSRPSFRLRPTGPRRCGRCGARSRFRW